MIRRHHSHSLVSYVLILALFIQIFTPAFTAFPLFQNLAPEHVALRQEAAAVIGENAAQEIGAAYHGGKLNKVAQLAAHAAVGCASGAVASGECASGAFGGIAGEVTGEILERRIRARLDRELNDGEITR